MLMPDQQVHLFGTNLLVKGLGAQGARGIAVLFRAHLNRTAMQAWKILQGPALLLLLHCTMSQDPWEPHEAQ